MSGNGGDGSAPGRLPPRRPRTPRSPTPLLNVDEYIRLLECIEREGGIATLDDIARSLPRVNRPISAVFQLCDLGILGIDLEAGFDGNMRVWRSDA